MKKNLINEVIQGMLPFLNNAQTEKLQEVLQHTLFNYTVSEDENKEAPAEQNLVESFLAAKRIEGCSEKSLKYYDATITSLLTELGKDVTMSSNDISLSGELPPYYMSNVTLEKSFSFIWADISLKGCLNNIFDEEYLSVLSRPMPGINFEFFIGITPKLRRR